MRLCFGTFASILCSGKGYGVTNQKLVGTMTQTIDSTCGYINNSTRVSKLLSCAENLSDGRRKRQVKGESELPLSKVLSEAENAKKENVVQSFKDKVVPMISNDKKRKVIFSLRDLIRDDDTLGEENKEAFKKHMGRSKDDLLKLCELDDITLVLSTMFPEILAGVFLYTVIETNNTVGKKHAKRIAEYTKRYSENNGEPHTRAGIKQLPKIDTLPFVRNKYFSGRSDLLEKIHSSFDVGNTYAHTTQVIYGLDGMGKTQIVLEYAHNALISDKGLYDAICWIDCSSKDAIKQSCDYFLSKIGEPTDLEVVSRLNHWLQTNSKWLLILDDVVEDALVERLMPKVGEGHILATAQQDKCFIVGDSTIRLECMENNEAVDFLIKRTNINDRTNAKIITERIGCLPLALEQAAAYICETGFDFNKFLKLLNEHELKLFDSRYSRSIYGKTIHTVWSITLDRLGDDTKRLLYCFAYMSADSVELDWLAEYAKKLKNEQEKSDVFTTVQQGKQKGKPINISEIVKKYKKQSNFTLDLILLLTDELALIKALVELKNYSIITLKSDYSFTMHTLLQEVIRNGIKTPSYLLSVGEALQAQCGYAGFIYDDYRIALSLQKAEPLIRNIGTFLEYREELMKKLGKGYEVAFDMETLNFQLHSFLAQYLVLIGEENGDCSAYEEADRFYSIACELALPLFGGGGEHNIVSNTDSFTLIQEKHRRMRVNLNLKRKDVAVAIYEEVKNVLINSITVNPVMVAQAFKNYADLWREFQFTDTANEAEELAAKCGAENS